MWQTSDIIDVTMLSMNTILRALLILQISLLTGLTLEAAIASDPQCKFQYVKDFTIADSAQSKFVHWLNLSNIDQCKKACSDERYCVALKFTSIPYDGNTCFWYHSLPPFPAETDSLEAYKKNCTICGQGYYSKDIQTCLPCPVGFYKAFDGNQPCTACPHNEITTKVGSDSVGECFDLGCRFTRDQSLKFTTDPTYSTYLMTSSKDECQKLCLAKPNCLAYMYGKTTRQFCLIYHKIPASLDGNKYESYTKGCTEIKTQCNFVRNEKIPIITMDHRYLKTITAYKQSECQKLCFDGQDCLAFRFSNKSMADGFNCHLFHKIPPPIFSFEWQRNKDTYTKNCVTKSG